MKIISRYVLKEHIGPFVFASTALTSLMLLQYIAKKFGDLVGKGLDASVIAEFMALSVPFTVAMTMPMAVLVAVLYAFSRLAAENEITAMKASGVNLRTVLLPVLLGGFAMSVVMIAFNDQVLPRSNHRLATLQLDIFRTKPTFALREQVINTVKEGQLYLQAGNIDEGSSRMTDVVIYDLSDPLRRRTIYADSGKLEYARNDLFMTLYDGVMMEVPNKKPGELTRLYYEKDLLRVKGVFNSYTESRPGTISKGDREMSVCEMQQMLERADFQVRQARHEMRAVELDRRRATGKRPDAPKPGEGMGVGKAYCRLLALFTVREANAQGSAPSAQAWRDTTRRAGDTAVTAPASADEAMLNARHQEARYRLDESMRERNRYDVEIQKKFSLAAACVIFVLIGAPVALRFPRGGVGLVIGFSFAIFGLYYVGLIGGETLADKGYLPPWVAMWAANIVLSAAGLILAFRMGRESSTSRGGDFTELLVTIRQKVFGWLRPFGVRLERRRV